MEIKSFEEKREVTGAAISVKTKIRVSCLIGKNDTSCWPKNRKKVSAMINKEVFRSLKGESINDDAKIFLKRQPIEDEVNEQFKDGTER